jgi:integrase
MNNYEANSLLRTRPMSDNGVRTALRTLGFDKDVICPHGFRAMGRTILEERLNYRSVLIELQIAHKVKDPMGDTYNRTAFIHERTEMMQTWADYLDSLVAEESTE